MRRSRLGTNLREIVTVPSQTRAPAPDNVTAEGGGKNTPTQGGGYGFVAARARAARRWAGAVVA